MWCTLKSVTNQDCLHQYSNWNLSPVALWYRNNNSEKLGKILANIKEMYYFTHKIAQLNYQSNQNAYAIWMN